MQLVGVWLAGTVHNNTTARKIFCWSASLAVPFQYAPTIYSKKRIYSQKIT